MTKISKVASLLVKLVKECCRENILNHTFVTFWCRFSNKSLQKPGNLKRIWLRCYHWELKELHAPPQVFSRGFRTATHPIFNGAEGIVVHTDDRQEATVDCKCPPAPSSPRVDICWSSPWVPISRTNSASVCAALPHSSAPRPDPGPGLATVNLSVVPLTLALASQDGR